MELKNAVAIVTGSATGIGAASVIEFAKRGCHTVITPLIKSVTPADVASAVVWLTSGADLVTGEFIIIDGGTHLGGAPAKAR